MFTEEENKIISLFYSGDYELAEQLMIATNNTKLVDKLICKLHKFFYDYRIRKERTVLHSGGCASNHVEGGYKNAIAIHCCNLLINGFKYFIDEYYNFSNNSVIEIKSSDYQNGLYAPAYYLGYFNKEILEDRVKKLGVRLIKTN